MHDFKYVTRKERAPVKNNLIAIITRTQNLLRDDFTFRFDFVGSDRRSMVTFVPRTNIGYDFDVNLEINDDNCNYTPKDVKSRIMQALNKIARIYGYDCAEDSTRAITIKFKDRKNSRILHSCDFAIVNNYIDKDGHKKQKYIRFNKKHNSYTWEEQPDGYYILCEKERWIKDNRYHDELRKLYLDKKNKNSDSNKHSRSLYAEAVHEICQRYGFYD